MPIFVPLRRTTLHIPGTGPAHDPNRGHLFVILTSPDSTKAVLAVSVSSFYDKCDKTCVLETGCHDFITRTSFVLYAKATILMARAICDRVTDGTITYRGLLSEEIFDRVCDGLLDSRHTEPRLRLYFNANAKN